MRGVSHLLCFLVCIFFALSFCSADEKRVLVIGVGECSDCKDNNIKTSQAFSGLRVTIDCKLKNGGVKRRGSGELDSEGKFKVSIPKEILKGGKLDEQCYAQLHSQSATPCPAHNGLEASKIVFKSETDGKLTFGPAENVKFTSALCASAFLWPLFKYPPLPKVHPWLTHPPLPKLPLPPIYKKPLPPPVPTPVPIYKPKPKPPIYKPPVVKPLPPPVPIYKPKPKPKPPVYKPPVITKPLPPPVPIYKPKPKPPVYKPPVITKPLPPPVPIYKPKPKPPVYKKPLPPHTFFPKPPFPFKKPCPPLPKLPPLPKFPPKVFPPHPVVGLFPPLPPHFPSP